MERKNEHKSASLDDASCEATPTPSEAETESKQPKLKSVPSSSTWTTPEKGRLKLNFDGSTKSKPKRSSIGGVYRDHTGKFVLGYAEQIGRATSSVAELVALKRGLELAVQNGWRDISIEGDFINVVNAIASGWQFRAKKDLEQYTEIAALLPQLGETTVSHVLREGNRVANSFAELGHKAAARRVWRERDTPPYAALRQIKRDAAKVRSAAAAKTHPPCRLTSRQPVCSDAHAPPDEVLVHLERDAGGK